MENHETTFKRQAKGDTKARHWFGTLNNPELPFAEFVQQFANITFATGQLEQGEQGTQHYQFVLQFKTQQRMSALKKVCGKTHWEEVRSIDHAIEYVNKEDTRQEGPWTIGKRPFKANSKTDWDEAFTACAEGRWDDIPAEVKIKHWSNLMKIHAFHIPKQSVSDTVKGMWVYGKSGKGKSSTVRKLYPEVYVKPQNKWFDGYRGENIVLLDDFDTQGACLSHYLKIWGDHYPCVCEIKGGVVASNWDKFIITSQYLPYELFNGPTLEAI